MANFRIMFSANVGENEKIDMANILSMPVTTSFGDYLGCPILDRRPRKTDFKKVIDKMHSKLAGWKSKSIAMAGRKLNFVQSI